MRQGISGPLFIVAAAFLGLAAGGWAMQRVAFDPATSRGANVRIFDNQELRTVVSSAAAAATSERLQREVESNTNLIDASFLAMLYDAGTRPVLNRVTNDVQATLLGERPGPVEIPPLSLVQMVRTEEVFDVAPATIAVDRVGWLALTRTAVTWMVPIAAALGAVALVLGVMARPTRSELVFGVGTLCVMVAFWVITLGFLVPGYLIPYLLSSPWASIFEASAMDQLPLVGGLSALLAVVGSLLVLSTMGSRRRKSRSWSSPVRPTRYNTEQRQWSR